MFIPILGVRIRIRLYLHTVHTHNLSVMAKRLCHSGDGETHTGWGEIFEHPTKTWACATHKQFTMQAVAVALAKATWVRGKYEEAM